MCCSLYLSTTTYSMCVCVRLCACMCLLFWLCKPEESKELSKVVALVSSARGLWVRWNQPDCTRGKNNHRKKRLKSSNSPPTSRKNLEGYIWVLHHLWGAVNARISPRCSHLRDGLFTAPPAWPLPVIWCTLHIQHVASLGFGKWISEARAASFLALCTRCVLSWAAESLNTCQAWLWSFRWHHEPSERTERESWREWPLTAKSINWMSGQLLCGLSCTALIKQSGHYVLNGQEKNPTQLST